MRTRVRAGVLTRVRVCALTYAYARAPTCARARALERYGVSRVVIRRIAPRGTAHLFLGYPEWVFGRGANEDKNLALQGVFSAWM